MLFPFLCWILKYNFEIVWFLNCSFYFFKLSFAMNANPCSLFVFTGPSDLLGGFVILVRNSSFVQLCFSGNSWIIRLVVPTKLILVRVHLNFLFCHQLAFQEFGIILVLKMVSGLGLLSCLELQMVGIRLTVSSFSFS